MSSTPRKSSNPISIPAHDGIELNVFKFGIFTISVKASFRAFALLVAGAFAFAALYLLAVKTGAL